MGLGVVARFASLVEAEVACGALRAAGFDAQLFDKTFGTVVWIDQTAIGGFRLVVPESELADATAYLVEVRRSEPADDPEQRAPSSGTASSALALALTLVLGPMLGWLVVGAKKGAGRSWRDVALGCLLVGAPLLVLLMVLGLLKAPADSG